MKLPKTLGLGTFVELWTWVLGFGVSRKVGPKDLDQFPGSPHHEDSLEFVVHSVVAHIGRNHLNVSWVVLLGDSTPPPPRPVFLIAHTYA